MNVEFKDRIVEYPNRYKMVTNGDGTITLTPEPGVIVEPGTPLNAGNMKALERQATEIVDTLTQEKFKWSIEKGVVFLEKVVE